MYVRVTTDRCGRVTLTPVNDRIRANYARYLRDEHKVPSDGDVFLQGDVDIQYFIQHHVPRRKRGEVREGYTVVIRMDTWDYGSYLGYDACNINPMRVPR